MRSDPEPDRTIVAVHRGKTEARTVRTAQRTGRLFQQGTQALAAAEGSANQQNVFIVPISAPSYPTETTSPERLFNIISITFITAVVYAVGFLMWSNVRDHRKA